MGIIIWLIVGGVCGWLASLIMRTDAQQGILLNIVVGIVGAVIAGLIFGANINDGITVELFLYSLLGAVILLAIVNLIRRGFRPLSGRISGNGKAARAHRAAFFFDHCSSNTIDKATCSFCSPGTIFVSADCARASIIIGTGGTG